MHYLEQIKILLDSIEISGSKEQYDYDVGIKRIVEILKRAKLEKKTLYICGNGGSAGIAQHMTADFLKNGGLRTYSMFGQPTMTCISNDLTYDYVFCKQLELMANKGDVLIAISSSGKSENIIKAINMMHNMGGEVITFSGFNCSNKVRSLGDMNVYVPMEHYGIVESIHSLVLQQLVDIIVEEDGIAMRLE